MADDKKTEKIEKTEEKQEVARGDRGFVGTASAAQTLTQRWHQENHLHQDVGDKHNPRKRRWVRKAGSPSLKQYARTLLKAGDALAKEWFANKRGAKNEKRSDKNQGRINLEKQASKAARRKKSQGKQAKATDAAAPVATTAGKK